MGPVASSPVRAAPVRHGLTSWGTSRRREGTVAVARHQHRVVVVTILAVGGATANGLRYSCRRTSRDIAVRRARQCPRPTMVNADVQINPPNFVVRTHWVSILACRAICRTSVPDRRQPREGRPGSLPTTKPSGVGFLEDAVAAA